MKSNERRIVPLKPDEEQGVIRLELGSGRSIEIDERGSSEQLTVRSAQGRLELRVRLTADGPVLDVEAIGLTLRSAGEVAVECERFVVNAREDVAIDAGGSISQRAAGDHEVEVSGESTHKALAVRVESKLGNVELQANDDVLVRGERIRLN
jgi:phage gp45-like